MSEWSGVRKRVLDLRTASPDVVFGGNLAPVVIDGKPATFESWYLHWLSEAEAAGSHAG